MALIHNSITLGLQMTPLIEDPNPSSGRVFLSGIGHDINYLTPIYASVYHYQTGTNINTLQATGYGNIGAVSPTIWGGNLLTSKGSIWTGRAPDASSNADKDAWSAYHRSLDPVNYPAKRTWYTVNNKNIVTLPYQDLYSSAGAYNTYIVYGPDVTSSTGVIYYSNFQSTTAPWPNNFFFEDTANNRLWGMSTSNGNYDYVGYVTNYDSTLPVSTGSIVQSLGTTFFIGADSGNNTYWVRNQDNLVGDPYLIYKIAPTGLNTTTFSSIVASAGNTVAFNHSRPSNLRYDAANLRVFYSSHFDGGNSLVPVRYQWDPTNTAGFFTSTTCTMTYGSVTAAGSYTFYAAKYGLTGGATSGDAFHIQPQQFRPTSSTGSYYLTFWLTDKASTSTNALSRWGTPAQRTMMTYVLNSATDSNLTYHSSYTFSTSTSIPRDWLPISSDGSQVVVPSLGQTQFFTFSTSTGWAISNTYPYEFVSVGLDQQNRLWGVGKETNGYYSVHMVTPTIPVSISVTLTGTNYVYTGTNILTQAIITAANSSGTLVASTLTLGIVGASMVFSDNGTRSITTTTNTTTGALVNLTITGGGINNITVGANI